MGRLVERVRARKLVHSNDAQSSLSADPHHPDCYAAHSRRAGGAIALELAVERSFDWPRFCAAVGAMGRRSSGVDLNGSAGETVFAAGAGTITFVGSIAGRGVISIAHNTDLRTTYEPVTASVTVGMTVASGAPIGILETGHAGCPVPACLHWGLKREEIYLDPLSLFHRRQIRLLPLRDSSS